MQIHAIMAREEAIIFTIATISDKNPKVYKKNMMFILSIHNNIQKHNKLNKNREMLNFYENQSFTQINKSGQHQNKRGIYFFFILFDSKVLYTSNSLSFTDLGDFCRLSLLIEFYISGMVYDNKSILLFPIVDDCLLSIFLQDQYGFFHFILIFGMISSYILQL